MLPYYLDQYLSCSDPQGKICSSFNFIIADWPCSEELQWVQCCSVWLQFHHSPIWNVSSHFSATNTMWVTVTMLWCIKVSGAHSTDMKSRWKLLLTYNWTLDPRSGALSQSLTSRQKKYRVISVHLRQKNWWEKAILHFQLSSKWNWIILELFSFTVHIRFQALLSIENVN